jgi:tryptophan synthase alpha chain
MSRISSVFRKTGHKALIPYLTVGYPDIETTLKAVTLFAKNGADIIELGIPFSDPLADGATIQESSHRALQNGITPEICLETAGKLRRKINIPLVFMTYFNPILSYGLNKFCQDCLKAGIDGIIVPDLPPEEGEILEGATRESGLDLIYLLSPSSTPERIRLVAQKSGGFIYLVSVTGVTGARNDVPAGLSDFISRVRRNSSLPLCVGFGISGAEQAQKISKIADGVIIGSRLIQIMKNDPTLQNLEVFIREIRQAID